MSRLGCCPCKTNFLRLLNACQHFPNYLPLGNKQTNIIWKSKSFTSLFQHHCAVYSAGIPSTNHSWLLNIMLLILNIYSICLKYRCNVRGSRTQLVHWGPYTKVLPFPFYTECFHCSCKKLLRKLPACQLAFPSLLCTQTHIIWESLKWLRHV